LVTENRPQVASLDDEDVLIYDGLRILVSNPQDGGANTKDDVFTFTAPGVIEDEKLAKLDVKKVNVYPNPYYAYNAQERYRFERFVTFNHLPQRVTIRIFNLAGLQVRKLRKDDDTQFLRWNLLTESGIPAGSGLYIAHIDMPDLKQKKILKLMIIQSPRAFLY